MVLVDYGRSAEHVV